MRGFMMLLRMLEMEHDFSVDELERIKVLYLAGMDNKGD